MNEEEGRNMKEQRRKEGRMKKKEEIRMNKRGKDKVMGDEENR